MSLPTHLGEFREPHTAYCPMQTDRRDCQASRLRTDRLREGPHGNRMKSGPIEDRDPARPVSGRARTLTRGSGRRDGYQLDLQPGRQA